MRRVARVACAVSLLVIGVLLAGVDDALAVQSTGDSGAPAISASGRYVAFESTAPELVAGDTNAKTDVFVRDAKDRLTERVSVSSSGVQANGDSFDASISDDGRYVSFTSLASNLVIGDTNGVADVFLFDRVTRAIERVSVSWSGGQLAFGGGDAAIAGGGRFVAFVSRSLAVPISCNSVDNNADDVYVYDSSLKHATYEVSTWDFNTFNGGCDGPAEGNGPSINPTISADGATVAFESDATDLEWNGGLVPPNGRVSKDTNGVRDVYVRSPGTGVRPASMAATGAQANGASRNASISDDGTRIAFESVASNLDQDPDAQSDIHVRMLAGVPTTIWASPRALGAGGASVLPSISGDGTRVSFESDAVLRTTGANQDTNGQRDIYQVRLGTQFEPQPLSFDDDQWLANGRSTRAAESKDGTCTAFATVATNLLPSFMADTNAKQDIYRHCFTPRPTRCHVDRLSDPPRDHPDDLQYGADRSGIRRLCASCAGDPVNNATGNLAETQVDFAIAGRGVGLDLVRTYNAQDAALASAPRAFGFGWSSSFGARLVVDASSGAIAVYHSDGQVARFTRRADGAYVPELTVQSSLTKNADGSYTYTLPDQRTFSFNAAGRLTAQADRNGNSTTLSYDATGNLTRVTDPAGRRIDLSYNADGTVRQAKDPGGRLVLYAYDGAKNLVRVTDVGGRVWQFAYDAKHRLTSVTDPRGATTTNVYDALDRVVEQNDPLGRKTTWSYDGDETRVTDPAGNITYELFRANLPVMTLVAQGTTSETESHLVYDANANLVSTIDPLGHQWNFAYDAQGNRTRATDPLNRVTTYAYDAKRNLTALTTASGRITRYGYDTHSNLTSVTGTLGNVSPPQSQTTTYAYDAQGQLTSATDPLNRTSRYAYNTQGDRTSATTPAGRKSTATYNTQGWLMSSVSGRGNITGGTPSAYQTTYTRDAYGRVTQITDPLGHVAGLTYDAAGNLTDTTDPDNRHTKVTFDLAGQPIQVIRGDGSVLTTAYDGLGLVSRQTDGLGNSMTYVRDPLGRTQSVTDPVGHTTRYTYDPAGRRTSLIDSANRTTTFAYDAVNRLTTIGYSTAKPSPIGYEYDLDDHVTAMTDGTGRSTWSYDSLGRLTASTNARGQRLGYGYDLANQLTALNYDRGIVTTATATLTATAGTVSRGYDDDGLLTSVADWLGHTTTFSYDADGNLAQTRRPNSTTSTLTTDANGSVTDLNDVSPTATVLRSTTPATLAGLFASQSESGIAAGPTQAYSYDGAQRLTGAGANTYRYDAGDNLVGLPSAGGARTQTFDAAHEMTSVTKSSDGSVVSTFTYDGDGNRTSSSATGAVAGYGYDQADQLTTYSGPNRATPGPDIQVQYTYDGSGLRQSRVIAGRASSQVYDRSGSLPALVEDGLVAYITGPDDKPVEQILLSSNTARYLHQDGRGSTRAVSDQSGAVIASYTYDAYGNRTSPATTVENPFGYNSQYTDESGLQYLNARYYDPATGQFLTRDPIAGETGAPYSYAADSPTNFADPTGLDFPNIRLPDITRWPKEAGEMIIGAADSATFGIIGDGLDHIGVHVNRCAPGYGIGGWLPVPGFGIFGKGAKLWGAAERAAKGASGLGDLTKAEAEAIQAATDAAGRPITVVGSAAKGTRRGVGSSLPIGKGAGTRSDIDYAAPRGSLAHFDDQLGNLPSYDTSHGIIPGPHDPNLGPGIRFEPGAPPRFIPGN